MSGRFVKIQPLCKSASMISEMSAQSHGKAWDRPARLASNRAVITTDKAQAPVHSCNNPR